MSANYSSFVEQFTTTEEIKKKLMPQHSWLATNASFIFDSPALCSLKGQDCQDGLLLVSSPNRGWHEKGLLVSIPLELIDYAAKCLLNAGVTWPEEWRAVSKGPRKTSITNVWI